MDTQRVDPARQVEQEHARLLERLRSLDNCLANILYYGEVCSDLRGFEGLRQRCLEIREALQNHIPEEEQLFDRLQENAEVRPLLTVLEREHDVIRGMLASCLHTLEALTSGDPLPEDLFHLQDRVQELSLILQRHIRVENQMVLPLAG